MDRPATFWMMEPMRKYATFSGRARRAEYWWFALGYLIVLTVASVIDGVLGTGLGMGIGILYVVVVLAVFIPSLSVTVRRLHDLDKSGWWMLLTFVPLIGAIVLLIWFCTQGTAGPNRFGADPLDPAGDVAEVFS